MCDYRRMWGLKTLYEGVDNIGNDTLCGADAFEKLQNQHVCAGCCICFVSMKPGLANVA